MQCVSYIKHSQSDPTYLKVMAIGITGLQGRFPSPRIHPVLALN